MRREGTGMKARTIFILRPNLSFLIIVKNYQPLLLLLFSLINFTFLAVTAAPTSNIDLIRKTCKKCAQDDPNLSYNFCVTSLQAAPESHCATNLYHLGMISINLTRHNVSDTRRYITVLLKNKALDPFVRACLHDCYDLYSDAIPTLRQAVRDYKSKHYEDANIQLSSVLDASTTCEDEFRSEEKQQGQLLSPLTKRNNDTFQLSAMALSIINMQLRSASYRPTGG